MNYRPKQCPKCLYKTETRFVEDGKPGKDVCGWDNKHFAGESKRKCVRFRMTY